MMRELRPRKSPASTYGGFSAERCRCRWRRRSLTPQWVEISTPSTDGPATSAPSAGSWLVLSHDPDSKAIAEDFTARFGSPTRRVIGADLSDEFAVLEAFTKAAADPELPPVGVIVFVGQRSFDGTDSDGALALARDLVWAVSATIARGRRRLAREVAAALVGRPQRSCGSRR